MIQKVVVEATASFKEPEEKRIRPMIRSTIRLCGGANRRRESMLVKIGAFDIELFGHPPAHLLKVLGKLLGFPAFTIELSLSEWTSCGLIGRRYVPVQLTDTESRDWEGRDL